MKKSVIIFRIIFIGILAISINVHSQNSYVELSKKIIESNDNFERDSLSKKLYHILINELKLSKEITPLDSTALLFELISSNKEFQIITWGINLDGGYWKYYGLIKSFNQVEKNYQLYELSSTDFIKSAQNSSIGSHNNWPSGIYLKLIENEFENKHYYTFIGWMAPDQQTAYKFIEVMTLNKNGAPNFGMEKYFVEEGNISRRRLFGYNRQSNFVLNFGEFKHTKKEWNQKKRKYDVLEFSDLMIVFDFLVLKYPHIPELPEFMVPSGNRIDAFKFEKGKWIFISDIDARNIESKENNNTQPKLKLSED